MSIPKMYYRSGFASDSFLTMRAKSVTWIVGTKLQPSPTIGKRAGSWSQAYLKCELKIASPLPYSTPADRT